MIEVVCDCTELDETIETLTEEMSIVAELVNQCVNENARKKQSQEEYKKGTTALCTDMKEQRKD